MNDIDEQPVNNILEKDYRSYIEDIVDKKHCSFLDACIELIEEYNIEPKVFASRIPQYIKNKIEEECIQLNKIKHVKTNQILFE